MTREDFNISSVVDRYRLSRHKIIRDTYLNYTVDKTDLIDIYRTFHSIAVKYTPLIACT